MTKSQTLDLLILLTALEAWVAATGRPLPNYLLEWLNATSAVLRDEVL